MVQTMSLLKELQLWRGQRLRLILSVMRLDQDSSELSTETIDVNGLAQIVGKLQVNSKIANDCLQLRVGVKKSENVKNMVLANITFEEFEKQISCSDEWVEVVIEPNIKHESSFYTKSGYVSSYTIVVDITVHATMPTSSVINNLLHEDTEFTDFQLHADDGTVSVHKAMLAVHGDMFKTMLRGDWKETNEGRININGVTVQTLRHLKEYMYLGTLPDEGLEPLLLISGPYLMEKLEEDCVTKLITTLKPEKFDGLIEFACQNNIPRLMKAMLMSLPDGIVNSVHKLKNTEQKSGDK